MLRNKKTKVLLSLFLIITLISTLSFAENETTDETTTNTKVTTTKDSNAVDSINATSTTDEVEVEDEDVVISEDNDEDPEDLSTSTTDSQDVHEGDLYLSGENVTMDKLVNGNVYIMANNVTVTGQVAGNLFILANKATFTDAYIESSVYLCANEVNFKAIASDLYACCNTIEIPANYGVYRDLKCYSNSLTILGIIGRNVECNVASLNLEKDDAKADIYGNLKYSSAKEIQIPEGAVQGETNFTQIAKKENKEKFTDYLISAAASVIFTLVIYGLALLFCKSSTEKCTKITSKKFLPAFGIGLLALIVVPIISFLLLISIVGASVSFALLVFYGLLLAISCSVFSISVANIVSEKVKVSNGWLKTLCVVLVSLLVYIISVLPYVSLVKFLFTILGFGTIIMNMFFKNINFEKKSNKDSKK